ncbi:MAG: homoserine kinase [Firmicutes bacterium]|nr:homoserine kinase [Bacillota bacterium]
MFEIKVPASSANLGIGFDSSALALSLYNTFLFEISEKTSFVGFEKAFSNESNLVYQSYRFVFQKLNRKPLPIKITLVKQEIPVSRGLGSSSACIIAGAMAANHVLNHPFTEQELLQLMVAEEGHPDNLVASFYGGLTSSFMDSDEIIYMKKDVSLNLHFYLLIPPFEVSTKMARELLPKSLPFKDVTSVLSRVHFLMDAFHQGDFRLLQKILKDKIHEPYRYPLIQDGLQIKEELEALGACVLISGSGSTLLVISKDNTFEDQLVQVKKLSSWVVKKTEVSRIGAQLDEVRSDS